VSRAEIQAIWNTVAVLAGGVVVALVWWVS
jgi:hypothetical protein